MTCLTIFGITFSCFRLPKISAGDISTLRAVKGTPLAYIIHDAPLQQTRMGKVQTGCPLAYQVETSVPLTCPVKHN